MLVKAEGLKPVTVWLYTGLFLVFSMIMVGAITRLTESGLSITEWNVVTGTLPPLSDEDWYEEFDKYKQTPEYLDKNRFYFGEGEEALQNFKKIFFWEWLHRFLGRFIGVVFLIPFLWFLKKGYFTQKAIPRLVFLFLLGGFQGFLGWYMVKSGLVNEPRVSHYRLAMHLCTALTTISLIWWFLLDMTYPEKRAVKAGPALLKNLWKFTFVILAVQIVYGAFVAGKDAGQIFNTWPLMDGNFVAEGTFDQKPVYLNLIGESNNEAPNLAGIQFMHRTIGILLFLAIWGLWIAGRFQSLRFEARMALNAMALMVVVQFALGVFTLLLAVPIWLGVLHQAGAVVLLLISLYFYHRIR
jgi:cytochrome c oxidase assembly protein subunit 15